MRQGRQKPWNETINDGLLSEQEERLIVCEIRIVGGRERVAQVVALDDHHRDAWYIDQTGEGRSDYGSPDAQKVADSVAASPYSNVLVSRKIAKDIIETATSLLTQNNSLSEAHLMQHPDIKQAIERGGQ